MSVIDNERTKLLANALDRASMACFTVGIVTPLAGYLYGIVDLSRAIAQRWPLASMLVWLLRCRSSYICGQGVC